MRRLMKVPSNKHSKKTAYFLNQLYDFIIQETMTHRSKGIIYNQQTKRGQKTCLSGGVSAETGVRSNHTSPLWLFCPVKTQMNVLTSKIL